MYKHLNYKKIKNCYPKLKLNKDVAVVFPSRRLLDYNYGSKIDSFAEVIRFNSAAKKFKIKKSGSKTTLVILNNHSYDHIKKPDKYLMSSYKIINQYKNKKILVVSPIHVNVIKNKNKNTYFFHSGKKKYFFLMLNFLKFPKLIYFFYTYYINKKIFSSGLYTILILIASGITPVIFGLDFSERHNLRSYYHKKKKLIQKPGKYHNFDYEKKILRYLKKKRLIKNF